MIDNDITVTWVCDSCREAINIIMPEDDAKSLYPTTKFLMHKYGWDYDAAFTYCPKCLEEAKRR